MKLSKSFSDLITYCRSLDRHYLPARYPNAIPGGTPYEIYTKQDSKESIIHAEKILKTVEMLLEEAGVLKGFKKEK